MHISLMIHSTMCFNEMNCYADNCLTNIAQGEKVLIVNICQFPWCKYSTMADFK